MFQVPFYRCHVRRECTRFRDWPPESPWSKPLSGQGLVEVAMSATAPSEVPMVLPTPLRGSTVDPTSGSPADEWRGWGGEWVGWGGWGGRGREKVWTLGV